jgi:hypothetical protein
MPWKRSSGLRSYSRCYRFEVTEESNPITESSESLAGDKPMSETAQVSVPRESLGKESSEDLAFSA